MRRGLVSSLAAILLVSLLGCGKEPGKELTPSSPTQQATPAPSTGATQNANTTPSAPSTSTPSNARESAQLIQQHVELWGDSTDPETLDVAWVGLDEKNQLVVAGAYQPRVAPTAVPHLTPARWLADTSVAQVLIRQEWPGKPGSLSILSRERYNQVVAAGAKPYFPSAEWPRSVDLYAEASGGPVFKTWSEQEKTVRDWLTNRLGSRLVSLKLSPEEEHLSEVTVVVKADSRSEQERIKESAILLAGLATMTWTVELDVEYQGAAQAHLIKVRTVYISEWAKAGAHPARLPACIEIDGASESLDKCAPHVTSGSTLDDLSSVLADRTRLQGLLPPGAHLVIGQTGSRWDPLLEVEAEVPITQPWDQAWATYAEVVDKLFTQEPAVFEFELLLRRGDELEYHAWDRNGWSIRHFVLTQGIKLEPATLRTGGIYHRYKVVGH
jgi:hypothetical protein